MAAWLGSLSVLIFWLGAVSVIVPLRLIGIRTRKAGMLVLVVGFVLVTVLAGIDPIANPHSKTEGHDEINTQADPLREYPFRLTFENGQVFRGKSLGDISACILGVRSVPSIACGTGVFRPSQANTEFLIVDLYMKNNQPEPLLPGDIMMYVQGPLTAYGESEAGNRAMDTLGHELFKYRVLLAKAAQIGVVVFEVPSDLDVSEAFLLLDNVITGYGDKLPLTVLVE